MKKKKIEDTKPSEIKEQQLKIKKLKLQPIQTLDFLYDDAGEITYEYPELTALCPMTGIQDLYNVRIIYRPDKKIPELKSLRFYFLSYRNIPILHEHLASKIFEDLVQTLKPNRLRLELEAAVRGGIYTRVVKDTEKDKNKTT